MAKEYLLVDGKLVKADTKLVQVPDTENLNDLADENGAYATQSEEVANEIEELIVKNGVIDGSPKGVYASLSALQTAFPTGASGVYLTSDNGHWYYWNGSAWTDGGVYQSSEDIEQIKEDLVNVQPQWIKGAKRVSNNLFNKYSVKDGFFVNKIDGSIAKNSNYCVSDYIEIDPNEKYSTNDYFHGAWYDDNKTFISGFGKLSNTQSPSNARYAIVDCYITVKDTFMFCKGRYIEYEPVKYEIEWLNENNVKVYTNNFYNSYFLNMFDKNSAIDNQYINENNGERLESASYFRSGFIEVKPNTSYSKSSNNRYAIYDENKVFISGGQSKNFTTPQDAKYVIISDLKTKKDSMLLCESEYFLDGSYSPYGIKVDWIISNNKKSKYEGKTLVCFGDSITNLGYTGIITSDTGIIATNVGLSSGRYAYSDDSNQYVNAFAFHNIVDSIISGDWTIPDSINGISGYETQYAHIQTIKTIDFNKIDFVSIAYGTNDFSSATPMDNPDNKYDVNYFKGAMRYCIKKLTEAYPHLKIVISTPIYRFWVNSGIVVDDCKTHTIGGFLLSDYNNAEIEVCKELNLPYISNLENGGINEFNRLNYFDIADSLHPNNKGLEMIGHRIGNCILSNY